jgi:hypothetical protein
MYVRYVDDITILVNNIYQCWDYDTVNNVMVHNSNLCMSVGPTTAEAHTFAVLQAVAQHSTAQHPQPDPTDCGCAWEPRRWEVPSVGP